MIAGIFVGGQSSRMGGYPKGRLAARDGGEPLVVRTSRLLTSLGLTPVLVGAAEAYHDLLPDLRRLDDRPGGIGPLGGLGALLAAADGEHVIALACDMPFVSPALIHKLMQTEGAEDIFAPRGSAGYWEPFCARYRVASVGKALDQALAACELSLQALFARLSVVELALSERERRSLRDWDTPEEIEEELEHEP